MWLGSDSWWMGISQRSVEDRLATKWRSVVIDFWRLYLWSMDVFDWVIRNVRLIVHAHLFHSTGSPREWFQIYREYEDSGVERRKSSFNHVSLKAVSGARYSSWALDFTMYNHYTYFPPKFLSLIRNCYFLLSQRCGNSSADPALENNVLHVINKLPYVCFIHCMPHLPATAILLDIASMPPVYHVDIGNLNTIKKLLMMTC